MGFFGSEEAMKWLVVTATSPIMIGFNYVAFLPALVEGGVRFSEGHVGFLTAASAIGAVDYGLCCIPSGWPGRLD